MDYNGSNWLKRSLKPVLHYVHDDNNYKEREFIEMC